MWDDPERHLYQDTFARPSLPLYSAVRASGLYQYAPPAVVAWHSSHSPLEMPDSRTFVVLVRLWSLSGGMWGELRLGLTV